MIAGDKPLPMCAAAALLRGAMALGAALLLFSAFLAPAERLDIGARQFLALQAAGAPVSVRANDSAPLALAQRALGQWAHAGGAVAGPPPPLAALAAPPRQGRVYAALVQTGAAHDLPRPFNARAPPHLRAA